MASKGWGTVIQYGNAATFAGSSTWTNLSAAVSEITPPVLESDEIDTSHLTTADMVRSSIPGWSDTADVEVTAHYDKTEYAAIYALWRTAKGWRIVFNDSDDDYEYGEAGN